MEAEWLRDIYSSPSLHVIKPDPTERIGYRKYDRVIVENISTLWFEDVPHYLGVLNSGMRYGGTIRIHCKTWNSMQIEFNPYNERLDSWLIGKGFSHVRREGDWLIGEKV